MMHSRTLTAIGAVALAGLSACAQPQSAPPPSATAPATAPQPTYPTTTHVTLFQFPDPTNAKACRVVALPYHAWVARDGDIVWDIVDDYCRTEAAYAIVSDDAGAVEEIAANPEPRKKRAKFRGRERGKRYKYTVRLGTYVHDPEFELWP
jgi:hypothetical protein